MRSTCPRHLEGNHPDRVGSSHHDRDATESTTVDAGFVSWLDIEIRKTGEGAAEASARVAVVYVGEVMNWEESIYDVLDADSAELELEALHDLFFDGGWLKEAYANGAGADLLYVSRV